MRVQAIRASETLYKAGDKSFEADYRQLVKDPDTRVDLQAILTLNLFKVPDIRTVITSAQAANKARGVQEIGDRILLPAMNASAAGADGDARCRQSSRRCSSKGPVSTPNCAWPVMVRMRKVPRSTARPRAR